MSKTKATKAACADLGTDLNPDFICRAMKSNPIELLENEALKFEHLFNQNSNPIFTAYHQDLSSYITYDEFLSDLIKTHNKTYSTKAINEILTAFCLRKDIDTLTVLRFSSKNIKNKAYIKNIVKRRPELTDWNYLHGLLLQQKNCDHQRPEFNTFSVFGDDRLNLWSVFRFYMRLDPLSIQIESALSDIYKIINEEHLSFKRHGYAWRSIMGLSRADLNYLLMYTKKKKLLPQFMYAIHQQSNFTTSPEYNYHYLKLMFSKGVETNEATKEYFRLGVEVMDKIYQSHPKFLDENYYANRLIRKSIYRRMLRTAPDFVAEIMGGVEKKEIISSHPWFANQHVVL